MMDELVAKIFVLAPDLDRYTLFEELVRRVGAQQLDQTTGRLGVAEFEVRQNPDTSERQLYGPEWMSYALNIEMFGLAADSEEYLGRLLADLHALQDSLVDMGLSFVTASDLVDDAESE